MLFYKFLIVFLFGLLSSWAYADECDNNFVSSGNLLMGASYKTFAVLNGVDRLAAFDGALSEIAKEPSWKILTQDKSRGYIEAVQAESFKKGKVIPLVVQIEAKGMGSKLDVTYKTPSGTSSPEIAIKAQFCKIIQASMDAAETSKSKAIIAQEHTNNSSKDVVKNTSNINPVNSEYRKNGMPCVKEICLGDGIEELKKIKWESVTYSKLLNIETIKKNYRGDLTKVAMYLAEPAIGGKRFDNSALNHLSEVVAYCNQVANIRNGFTGNYVSDSGHETRVDIAMIPSDDQNQQKWTVISISRSYSSAYSAQQLQQVKDQLHERYGEFLYYRERKLKNGAVDAIYSGSSLKIFTNWPNIDNALKMHPLCNGKDKINID